MPKKITIPEPEENLEFIDVHCHLPFPRPTKNDKLPPDTEQYKEFFELGGKYLINSTIDNHTLKLTLNFLKNKNNYGFTCGWAPQTVTYTPKNKYDGEWKKWAKFVEENYAKALAFGEIGLDFHHAKLLEKREKQVSELRKIFELTKQYKKPYILHVRNATEHEMDPNNPKHRYNNGDGATKEILSIINEFNINPNMVMWHCFSGPEEYSLPLSKQGFMFSVPSSAYGNNKWRRNTEKVPLKNLLTETDSYYQHPFLRGPVNVPSNVRYSIAAIAYSHKVSQKEVSEITVRNAVNFFNLSI
jgi:TatD DNase family protein